MDCGQGEASQLKNPVRARTAGEQRLDADSTRGSQRACYFVTRAKNLRFRETNAINRKGPVWKNSTQLKT